MVVPSGWVRDANEKDYGGYVESRWHEPGSPEVYLLVDYTVGFAGTAASGARGVRDMLRRNDEDYRARFAAAARSLEPTC
jgi:hypothetical protein